MISLKTNRRLRFPFFFGFVALVVLIVLVVLVVLFRVPISGVLWQALSPVLRARDSLGLSQTADLRAELASNAAALADRDALYRENLELKAILGRPAPLGLPSGAGRVLAAVIERPPGIPYDTLGIDAGTAQGVAPDNLVSAGGGALIGKVSEAYAHTARVVLFSAPSEGHEALLISKNAQSAAVPLSVEGQGGGSMVASVPAGTSVVAGDIIVFPGIAGGLTGEVSAVDVKESESFVTIYLHLPVNLFEIRYVEVWKSK